jgi:hypothetical protein
MEQETMERRSWNLSSNCRLFSADYGNNGYPGRTLPYTLTDHNTADTSINKIPLP